MGWSLIRSRLPSAAAAAANPGWSRTLLVPWSGTITCADGLDHQRVFPDRGEGRDAVRGPVERRHPDRHRRRARCLDRRVPAALVQGERVVVGGDVEPDPAAVLERPQVELDVHLVHAAGAEHDPALVDPRALGLAAVDVDAAAALEPQLHRPRERRPAPPVAGGERVEVRPERHLALLRQARRGARRDPQPAPGDRRALECRGCARSAPGAAGTVAAPARCARPCRAADAHGVAGAGQEHPLKQRRHAQSSTVSEPARALPAVKYGAMRLSNMVSALSRSPCACRGTGRCPAGRRTARSRSPSRLARARGRRPAARGRPRC